MGYYIFNYRRYMKYVIRIDNKTLLKLVLKHLGDVGFTFETDIDNILFVDTTSKTVSEYRDTDNKYDVLNVYSLFDKLDEIS